MRASFPNPSFIHMWLMLASANTGLFIWAFVHSKEYSTFSCSMSSLYNSFSDQMSQKIRGLVLLIRAWKKLGYLYPDQSFNILTKLNPEEFSNYSTFMEPRFSFERLHCLLGLEDSVVCFFMVVLVFDWSNKERLASSSKQPYIRARFATKYPEVRWLCRPAVINGWFRKPGSKSIVWIQYFFDGQS